MVINLYAETIDQMVALAVLMPIVASMGGNAGTQTMTVAVRAICQPRELTPSNAIRVSRREVTVGAINGICVRLADGTMSQGFWFGVRMLAAVIALAMVLTLILPAALGGIVIPDRAGEIQHDPALASGRSCTTITRCRRLLRVSRTGRDAAALIVTCVDRPEKSHRPRRYLPGRCEA